MRPGVAEVWLRLHVVAVHVVEVDAAAVVTTLLINDHSHEEGFFRSKAQVAFAELNLRGKSICLLWSAEAGPGEERRRGSAMVM